MQIIHTLDYNIKPDTDITEQLSSLIESVKDMNGKKTVVFTKGVYYISAEKCVKQKLYITNTISNSEYKENEPHHVQPVAFYFKEVHDLVFDGSDSVFIIDGKATNLAAENCHDLTVKNLEVRHKNPDFHEIKVIKKSPFSADFQTDSDSNLSFNDGKPCFYGSDYCVKADEYASNAFWTGLIRADWPNKVKRTNHPLFAAMGYKKLGKDRFRAYFPSALRFKTGDRYYIYDARRNYAGIFINECSGVSLENVRQRFNYSLAVVLQCSEDISVKQCEFSPGNGPLKLASAADFMQVCMCRGRVAVEKNYFEGAGDDCVNVHGIHFKIVEVKENKITVRFMHPQSYGFNPIKAGDRIAFVDPETLLEKGCAAIEKSEMISDYDIRLTLNSAALAETGMAVEDLDACPDFDFLNNTVNRIITRGILVTTRGRVNISNNHFISTTMSGILLSDDAFSWYESGPCRNVCISNNDFDYCGSNAVLIKPENKKYAGAVHKNISISNNRFKKYKGYCISAKAADSVTVKQNIFADKNIIKTDHCSNVTVEDNR